MMHQKFILFLILLFYFGCNQSTESDDIYGCTIFSACNFNSAATIFDDSCINELDCWGECGTAIIDECGVCGGDDSTCKDCNGDRNGSAYLDGCQNCVGGNTGLSACTLDCFGNVNGTAFYDNCSACVSPGDNSCVLGCDGMWVNDSTQKEFDGCNVCGGDGSSCPRISLSVSQLSISVGENAELEVNISNIENLYAISFEIMFDHRVLEIDMESGVVSYDQFTGDNFGPVVYFDDGSVSFVLGGNNINGRIFSVTINSKQAGTTNIELDKVNLIQEDGTAVFNYSSLILENVEITVTSE